MKKNKKIGLGIAICVVAVIVFLFIWQWDNIKALYMGVTYSDEKIETKIGETKEKLAEKLEKEGVVNQKIIDGFSKEDEEKIAKGELSVEEAVEKLFEDEEKNKDETSDEVSKQENNTDASTEKNDVQKDTKTEEKNSGEQNNKQESTENASKADSSKQNDVKAQSSSEQKQSENNTQSESNSSSNSESKKLIEAAVKEMYTLKATFVQQLAAIERAAKQIYIQGEMTTERKMEIADAVMPQLVDAERSCDAQVEAILSNLKNSLSAIGADTSVVEDIREQYNNEKQLQKSKYISKYM